MLLSRKVFRKFAVNPFIQDLIGSDFDLKMHQFISPTKLSTLSEESLYTREAQSDHDRNIFDPFFYYFENGGKRFRPAMTQLCSNVLGIKGSSVEPVKLYVESIHHASLLIDDIQDSSTLRRGKPVSHLVFGIDSAISSGCRLISVDILACLLNALKLENPSDELRVRRVHERLIGFLFQGTTLDIAWHKPKGADFRPRLEDYLGMVDYKSVSLIAAGAAVLSELANKRKEFEQLLPAIVYFGRAFQIYDDVINLDSKDYQKLKGVAEDIIEGKVSFPVLHLASNGDPRELYDILNNPQKDQAALDRAIEILRSSESIEAGKNLTCGNLHLSLEKILENFGPQTADLWIRFCKAMMPLAEEAYRDPEPQKSGSPSLRVMAEIKKNPRNMKEAAPLTKQISFWSKNN